MGIEANSKIESLKKALFLALSDLHRRDWVLFGNNVNERTVCARLMFYLEYRKYNRWFRHYFIDVDYNRGESQETAKLLADATNCKAPAHREYRSAATPILQSSPNALH